VPEKTNEITAIPELLDHLTEMKQLEGALVTIDAMGCQVEIADKIVAHKADFLLALKGNQPTLAAEVEDYFRTAPEDEVVRKTTVEKDHGRIETRIFTASKTVDWIEAAKTYPGQSKFNHIKTILKVVNRTEFKDHCTQDTRLYICSAALDIERLAHGARAHWGVESMHWLLDTAFKDDLSRYRSGFGAKNMAVIRRFALNLIRADKSKGSVKTKRKSASWDKNFLLKLLQIK
jgi:predicted transposase YbfD/YdcC